MQKNQPKHNRQNAKQNLQSVSIFKYYLQFLFPTLFESQNFPSNSFTKLKATHRNITYNYVHEIYSGFEDASQETVLQAAKQVYSSSPGVTVLDNMFLKQTALKIPYLPIWRQTSERIDIFITKEDRGIQKTHKNDFRSPHRIKAKAPLPYKLQKKRSIPLISLNNIDAENGIPQPFSLYVVHHSHSSNSNSTILWENFVERYQFQTSLVFGERRSHIAYDAAFSYNSQVKIDQSHKFPQIFYQNSIFSEKDEKKLPMPQNFFNKLRNLVHLERSKKKIQQESSSFDPIHRREEKLTPESRAIFNNLKVKTFAFFSSINRKRDANRYFLQNLICRMMRNNNYSENESWEAIKYYLQFEKRMREKYQWSHFDKYDKMNIFAYIGKDMMGRPILLNRIRNTLCSKIQNFDEFFDYHLYLFEIYMQDQMEGWVDQFVVIADASNQVSDNTNLGFTKKLIFECMKLTIDRPYKIVAFDIGFIGTTLYRILKQILPSSLTDRVRMFGEDRNQLLEELRVCMTDESIPEFLGGRNVTMQTKKQDHAQQRGSTELTSDRSMQRSVKRTKNL